MSKETTETVSSSLDTVKLGAALVLLLLGLTGFYYFAGSSTLYRVLGLLAVVGVAVALFLTTAKGHALMAFMRGARTEVRKMVWPTRQEALQTTLIVMVLVVLVGIFLWLVDMLLGWGIKQIIGGA
jgi:preprotein translocase subunit SecE